MFPTMLYGPNHQESVVELSSFLRGGTSSNAAVPEADGVLLRRLNETRGQAVLTFMYLCVLGLCFMTAVVYFCRMQWEERYLRRLREHELSAMRSAMAQSEASQREESRAVQRKYIEERRARILQLFGPVRMTLEPENFSVEEESNGKMKASSAEEVTDESIKKNNVEEGEEKETETKNQHHVMHDTYGDEDESLMVEIPAPGLHLSLGVNEKPPSRVVSGMCTICLCSFQVGSDVVWSSNELCEHVFHATCIEKWLMKQREGPLCPCCRRDFIVDPYDMETNQGETFDPSMIDAEVSTANRVQTVFQRGAEDPAGEAEA